LIENVINMGGWLKTSEYRHIGERGLKLLKKTLYDISTFPETKLYHLYQEIKVIMF